MSLVQAASLGFSKMKNSGKPNRVLGEEIELCFVERRVPLGYSSEVVWMASGFMDLVSRRHWTKDRDLNVIVITLIAAVRIHESAQEEQ